MLEVEIDSKFIECGCRALLRDKIGAELFSCQDGRQVGAQEGVEQGYSYFWVYLKVFYCFAESQ